jgi:pyruvyltransferase
MITIAYSTKSPKPELIEHFKKSSGYEKGIHVIEKINNGEKSLAQVYNEILNESPNDIIILTHDDMYFDTKAWYSKIVRHFEKSDFGVLGMAGTSYLSESGIWWEASRRKNMVGIVNHEKDGKKWESKMSYSENFGNDIRQTVVVDGVFIAVHKGRIKKQFNEDFKGFHFYDLPFCLENHLEGVKIGVITNIRITHKSIGITNDQWETNRKLFVEKYHDHLPQIIPFDPNRKIKVLLSCISFRNFTGSEVYVYELAKGLQKQNCEVTILSQIGGPLTTLAKKDGIKCVSFENAPGFKLGDGKWVLMNNQGKNEISQPNVLYKVGEVDFDIIHIQHKPVAERILSLYPLIDKVSTIHSEVISLENPVIHESIKKYIAIRPEIKNHLIEEFKIDSDDIEIIYNPVDKEKFTFKNTSDKNYVLFVGTIDYLRRETIMDLIEYTKENNKELWLVGEDNSNYLDIVLRHSHVKRYPSTWDLSTFLKNCSETAGIQLGRTTIESWMSGKKSWIYKVDSNGTILSKELTESPTNIEKFYTENVAKKVRNLYLNVLSEVKKPENLIFNGREIKPSFDQNWGDLVSGEIVKKLSPNPNFNNEMVFNVKTPHNNYPIISTGSVMSFTNPNSIVWGTGCIDQGKIGQKPKKIFAVRGPNTRNELLKKGWSCPEVYGDPALLFPKIYNPKIEKKYKLGFIPHYIEYETLKDLKILHHIESLGVQIINICAGEYKFIDELLECEKIISSSLHGLIVADAYGIPNARVNVSNKLIGGDFKFIDYYKSVDRKIDLGLQLNTFTTLEDIYRQHFNDKINIDLVKLLDSAPWNDTEYKHLFI